MTRSRAQCVGFSVALSIGLGALAPALAQADRPRATELVLDSGRTLTIDGAFAEVDALWDDTALVFRDDDELRVLDGGAGEPRTFARYPRKAWYGMTAPVLSGDRRTYFTWILEDLVAFDTVTGDRRRVHRFPTHLAGLDRSHPDPRPVWRDAGPVEDVAHDALLCLVQEERNEAVASWQRRDDRRGEHWLLSIPADGGDATVACGGRTYPGRAVSWDVSRRRGELYVLVQDHKTRERSIVVRSLEDGRSVGAVDVPAEGCWEIALSPDEDRVLLMRGDRPGATGLYGGFVLHDLATGERRDGPPRGRECAWSPDGGTVAYLEGWSLRLFDVRSGESRTLVHGEPWREGDARPTYWTGPRWSDDGRRLAVCVGGEGRSAHVLGFDHPTLLLDLEREEFLVLSAYAQEITWSPIPEPFGEAVR